jgi:hypothetical protein
MCVVFKTYQKMIITMASRIMAHISSHVFRYESLSFVSSVTQIDLMFYLGICDRWKRVHKLTSNFQVLISNIKTRDQTFHCNSSSLYLETVFSASQQLILCTIFTCQYTFLCGKSYFAVQHCCNNGHKITFEIWLAIP